MFDGVNNKELDEEFPFAMDHKVNVQKEESNA